LTEKRQNRGVTFGVGRQFLLSLDKVFSTSRIPVAATPTIIKAG
jgi:hypothetical protein